VNETRITRARTGRETGQADAGVKRCAQLMTDGAWETGASAALVAAEFGVSVRTVETWASMASRAIRMAIGDGEELRERVAMSRTAVSMGGVEYANPDVKAATNAVKTMAELMGLMVQKHEHAHVVASYEAMPSADKAKWLRSKAAELLEEADRLDGVVRVQADASDDA
jgi:hypothetical protein